MMTFKHKNEAEANGMHERLTSLIRMTRLERKWHSGHNVSEQVFTVTQDATRGKDGWRFETRLHINEKALAETDIDTTEEAAGVLFMSAYNLGLRASLNIAAPKS